MIMRKKDIDRIVKKLLKDSTKTYTQVEIRQIFSDSLTTDQLIRVYRRYIYLKYKNMLK